jgi:hypothetical protein
LIKQAKYIILLFAGLTVFVLSSCNNDVTAPTGQQDVIVYEKPGLVDSAVVNGCYPNTRRFFVDTLDLTEYSKLRVEFDGAANSDGSFIKVYSNTESSTNIENYSVEDAVNINTHHDFMFNKPADKVWMEVRIYINPPVCGEGEFKFTSARDLKIYGIK